MNAPELTPEILEQLAQHPDTDRALVLLDTLGLADPQVAARLADQALESAESDPERAARWLSVASALARHVGKKPLVLARIHYAQARLALAAGLLEEAEKEIRQAQRWWRRAGDRASLARSALGLTQVWVLQGRYAEAEHTIRQALQELPANTPLRAQALVNLANLLRRREHHAEALECYRQAEAIYRTVLASAPPSQAETLRRKVAYAAVNQANALMALDRPLDAEKALRDALAVLRESDDRLNLGRTWTNLGTLYLRIGHYTQALEAFQQAAEILQANGLLGDSDPARQADVLLLEQAKVYLALNLIPEAIHALQGAIQLFQEAGQPYELGQSLYTLALVHLRNHRWDTAQELLDRAEALFAEIENPHWQYRVRLAQATLAFRREHLDAARALLAQVPTHTAEIPGWDLALQVEATLLRLQVDLAGGQVDRARQWAEEALPHLMDQVGQQGLHLPHLSMALVHAQGSLALAAGQISQALQAFRRATELLEQVRVRLPMEEAKAAYLDDKESYYGGWAAALLARGPAQDELTGPVVAELFGVAERARARILLERLHAATSGDTASAPDRESALRRELHWLYNQLLDVDDPAVREERQRQVAVREAALARLAWQQDALQAQVQTIGLAQFQAALAPDEQALVYYWLSSPLDRQGPELLAFVVSREEAYLVRGLAREPELDDLATELRFQMGRMEVGAAYAQRHRARLLAGVQETLGALYRRLVAPLAHRLWAPRLRIVPHGLLHRLPIHALWDGERYLMERMTCRYAPSPGVAVHLARLEEPLLPKGTLRWAGLAPEDPSIPGARMEVERAAPLFQEARLYLGDRADEPGLQEAGSWAHILHLATHGLFRPDNPFFSALKLADGWIDVRRLYRLPLQARLVVLSACESGAGRVHGGDEVIGLVRGFLGAGARSLVVTLWNVHDHSAVRLIEDFYRALQRTGSTAQALGWAQEQAVQREEHPYLWAPFMAVE